MTDKVLWRKLTDTDMSSMLGLAAPSGTGGGARHISIGTNQAEVQIWEFLGLEENPGQSTEYPISIEPIPGMLAQGEIIFSCDPRRRGGEWRIVRQTSERYPLWTPTYGFPTDMDEFEEDNPPVIFVFRIGGQYHIRYCLLSELETTCPAINAEITAAGSRNSGILDYQNTHATLLSNQIIPATAPGRVPPVEGAEDEEAPAQPEEPEGDEDEGRARGPRTTTGNVTRWIRDSRHGKELKELYNYRCCFCDLELERPHHPSYVESCHIKPLNESSNTPGTNLDTKRNLLILCPNHHVELDFGAITIHQTNPTTRILEHINPENPLHGKVIELQHDVGEEFLNYHYEKWTNRELMGV